MKCLIFGQLLVCLTLSLGAHASSLRKSLHESIDNLSYENCLDQTGPMIYTLDHLKVDDFKSELKNEGHESVLSDMWSIKIRLHERLRSFYRVGKLSAECAQNIRGTLRGIRTFEDYIELNHLKLNSGSIAFPSSAFDKDNRHVRRHPEFLGFNLNKDLKSGDIILSRGNAYTSAAISSLGEFDTQFSHLSVVYKDKAGKLWTVEAHIEVGSFVRPLEEHIEDSNYRTMIYRFEDEKLAEKAAEYIFNKVKKASDTTGNILYDFGFDLDESSKLFCSEVATNAYEHASNGTVMIPMFRSQIMDRKPDLVKQLGLTVDSSFIPSDMEIDPRFKVVAEWRDSNRTNDILQKDALIQTMFKWSDEMGYVLQQGSSKDSFIYRNVAWPLRRVPLLKKYFINKLPINMSRQLIGYFGVLETMGKLLQEKLKPEDVVALESNGFPLMKDEKYEILEEVRLQDLSQKKQKMHKMFRPKTGKN